MRKTRQRPDQPDHAIAYALASRLYAPILRASLGRVPAEYRSHSGSTMYLTRSAAGRHRFSVELMRSEDHHAYLAALDAGLRMLTLDPFDHLVIRKADKSLHTSRFSDRQVRRGHVMLIGSASPTSEATLGMLSLNRAVMPRA